MASRATALQHASRPLYQLKRGHCAKSGLVPLLDHCVSCTMALLKLKLGVQDFLGGNAKCVVMANISGATGHAAHTAHTLAFARRAKNIVNTV